MNKEIHARWLIKYPYIVETVYDPDGNGFGRIHDNDYVRTYTREEVEKVREEYEYYKNRLAEMENGLIVEEE